MRKSNKNIIAIESWDDGFKLKHRAIMKNLLDLLSTTTGIEYRYHYLYTPIELSYTFKHIPVSKSSLLYIALHGSPSKIFTGAYKEFEISLNSLSAFMGRRFEGYGIHFASCATMNGWESDIKKFKDDTGVSFVSGFTKYVDFTRSAIVDHAFLAEWVYSRSFKRMKDRMFKNYKELLIENGFELML